MVSKEFEIAGYDMPCVDLAVNVDVFPKPNGGTGVNAMSWQGGGKVATGMVAAARLGAKCAMMQWEAMTTASFAYGILNVMELTYPE